MEILLIGASKGLGLQILKEAIKKEIKVNCLIRKKSKLNLKSPFLKKIYGDATNYRDLEKSVGNSEVIISTINVCRRNIIPWSALTNSKTTVSTFAKNTLNLSKNNINRIITISAWGVGDSIDDIPKLFKLLIKFSNLKYPYIDHDLHEKIIEKSNFNWTILRPSALTNEQKYHEVVSHEGNNNPRLTVGRKSLARFIIGIIENKYYFKKKLVVSRK
tara:strand:+ start:1279 stop:1929 length:651 start_codon:yes stop_codon:yes gene_type:complete